MSTEDAVVCNVGQENEWEGRSGTGGGVGREEAWDGRTRGAGGGVGREELH